MDPQSNQQNGTYGHTQPAPIAPNPSGAANTSNQQQIVANHGGQAMASPHLLELMTNPALAAAAAASPLFPPAAMITNPGALYAMPDLFASNGGVNTQHANPGTQQHNTTGSRISMANQHAYQLQVGQHAAQLHAHGASIPGFPIPPTAASSLQANLAAAAAAARAMAQGSDSTGSKEAKKGRRKKDLSLVERAKQNRDRNREHARSTRMRKKAYIQRLKELVEGLHSERTEEVRQRRVAIQHLAEVQNVRRVVIRNFLQFLSNYERDKRKWSTILEEEFWLKQPVTPYRCFRRSEIENESRFSRRLDAVVADAASIAVMIESVGSRSSRWTQSKREDFFLREEERTGRKHMPRSVTGQSGRFHHAISSLSASSSNSSNTGSSGEEGAKTVANQNCGDSKIISNSSESSQNGRTRTDPSAEFHDYHAKPLPDPKLADSERSSNEASDDSPEESNGSANDTKRVSTDSSSGDDAAAMKDPRPTKRQKHDTNQVKLPASNTSMAAPTNLPHNIARKGGISHNVRAMFTDARSVGSKNPHQSVAPAIPLPPFSGIGKKSQASTDGTNAAQLATAHNTSSRGRDGIANEAIDDPAVIISGDAETSSSNSSRNRPQVRAYFHVNEDDLILMEDVLMCPFVFRTQDAVLCGALAECVMPGMLRAHFSNTNKLKSVEMTYDAMGFMQQLERASGNETSAQIIPGSLEMALSPNAREARVITLAEKPYQIVNVNETWTKLTKYTQMEVEGVELMKLLEGEVVDGDAVALSNAPYDLEDITEGCCKCATRLHFDKEGREYVDFISSYPLTNTNDEITHILHVSKELPPIQASIVAEVG